MVEIYIHNLYTYFEFSRTIYLPLETRRWIFVNIIRRHMIIAPMCYKEYDNLNKQTFCYNSGFIERCRYATRFIWSNCMQHIFIQMKTTIWIGYEKFWYKITTIRCRVYTQIVCKSYHENKHNDTKKFITIF